MISSTVTARQGLFKFRFIYRGGVCKVYVVRTNEIFNASKQYADELVL